MHLDYTHCSVSAPSGQQPTTALKGGKQMENETGKGEKKKRASLHWENVLHAIAVSCKNDFAIQGTFLLLSPSFSVHKTIGDFPQTLEDFWSLQVERGMPTHLQLNLVICFESWMKGSTGSMSVSMDLKKSPVQHRKDSSRCLSMRLLQSKELSHKLNP